MKRKIAAMGVTLAGLVGCNTLDYNKETQSLLEKPVVLVKEDKGYEHVAKKADVTEDGIDFYLKDGKAVAKKLKKSTDCDAAEFVEEEYKLPESLKKAVVKYNSTVEAAFEDNVLSENELEKLTNYRNKVVDALKNTENPDYQGKIAKYVLKTLLSEVQGVIGYAKAHPNMEVYMAVVRDNPRNDIGLSRTQREKRLNPQKVDLSRTDLEAKLGEEIYGAFVKHFEDKKLSKYRAGKSSKDIPFWFEIPVETAEALANTDKVGVGTQPRISPRAMNLWKEGVIYSGLQLVKNAGYDVTGQSEAAKFGGPVVSYGKKK